MSRPLLLASVATLAEAKTAVRLGADIVDLKDPHAGALGAWPEQALRDAVRELGCHGTLSATTGDLPMQPEPLAQAAGRVAATGVRYVKVGFFSGEKQQACIEALGRLARDGIRLVAVLMADQKPDLSLLPAFAAAGFAGVMLDTADKRAGGLRTQLDERVLGRFVADAHAQGLLAGLAGSLGVADVAPLAALGPDYLGFRGALCRASDRSSALDPERFIAVLQAVRAASRLATATAAKQVSTAGRAAAVASTRSLAAR